MHSGEAIKAGHPIKRNMQALFHWMIRPPLMIQDWRESLIWWECRRIPYNLIVGAVGLVSLLLFYWFIDLAQAVEPGEDAIEPFLILLSPLLINLCYTAGWLAEMFLRIVWRERSRQVGPILFKLGLSFSLLVVLLPSALGFIIWLMQKN